MRLRPATRVQVGMKKTSSQAETCEDVCRVIRGERTRTSWRKPLLVSRSRRGLTACSGLLLEVQRIFFSGEEYFGNGREAIAFLARRIAAVGRRGVGSFELRGKSGDGFLALQDDYLH